MNKNHKHVISLVTGICRNCGLSADQKLTAHCYHKQLKTDVIKLVVTGKIDYDVTYGWFNPNDFMKPHPTPKSTSHDVDNSGSMNYLSKSTYEIVGLDEFSPEVKEAINRIIDNLGVTKAKPTTEELAAGIAEVFSEAFKTNESPNFSDLLLELLQQIKDNPIPVNDVLSFGLSKPSMDRLRTLLKYGAVTIHSGAYWVTQYGNDFLVEPEKETEPVLTVGDVGLLMSISHEGTMDTSMISDLDYLDELDNLRRLSMVYQTLSRYTLTQKAVNYVNKVLALPLI